MSLKLTVIRGTLGFFGRGINTCRKGRQPRTNIVTEYRGDCLQTVTVL
jgi:hypothetical protein